MGLLGRYIDALPDDARDRLIEAQEWCIAEVVGPGRSRCLIGHAEDWRSISAERLPWRSWMDAECGANASHPRREPEGERICDPLVFAFRRAEPGDRGLYRTRIDRWGIGSESRIGARFDSLCARRGMAAGVRLVKQRAARAGALSLTPETAPALPPA
jgi:hypothetical protein